MKATITNILVSAVFAFAFGALQTVQAATKQSFLFYGQSGTSYWSDKNSWKYNNGGNTANWTTPSGAPDGGNFSYDVYFRSGMAAPNNNNTQDYNPSWDHVVTFSGAQQVGVTHKPLHIDAGSSEDNPIVFTATQDGYGLTSSNSWLIGEAVADGFLKVTRGTYSMYDVFLGPDSAEASYMGVLCLDATSERKVNFSATHQFHIDNGAFYATNATVSVANRFRIGKQSGTTAKVVKVGGDWSVGEQFRLAGESGTTGEFTMDGGKLDVTGKTYIGCNSGFTKATFTLEAGEFTANAETYIPYGQNGTGELVITGGTFKANGNFLVANGSGSTGIVKVWGGALELNTYAHVGYNSSSEDTLLDIRDGGIVRQGGSYLVVGRNSDSKGTMTIGPGGVYENIDGNGNMVVSYASGSVGTLNVAGGEMTIKGILYLCFEANADHAVVNVTDGGVLTAKQILQRSASANKNSLTIDGGTLKAYADNDSFLPAFSTPDKFHVYVGANGATIDTAGHNVTIGASLEDKPEEVGAVTFTGGGTITLSGTPSYTGGTTNVAGTVLSLTAAAKTALVACPITVEIPPVGVTDGTTVLEINDGNGMFIQSEVDAIAVTGPDASRYALVLADEGTKIVISDTLAGEYVWNGGSSGEGWHTNGKWSKNGTPGDWYDSTAAVFANAGDAVAVDSAVTAASVTFRANATIGGSATLTVPVVSVVPDVLATISAPTAGELEKTGTGTLTLGTSRTEQTDVTEGTLVMSGDGTTIPWDSVMLGTESGKTAVMEFVNGATLESSPWNLSLGHDSAGPVGGGVVVELYKECGDWNVRNRLTVGWNNGDAGKFYHNGGTMTVAEQLRVSSQTGSSGEFTMNDGTVTVVSNLYVGCNANAVKGVFNMNGGTFTCNGTTYVPYSQNDYPAELYINGGTFKAAGTFVVGYGANSEAVIDLSSTAGTSGVLETKGLTLGSGSATLTFNGGELKAVGDLESTGLIKNGITVRVGANGGIVNANGKAVTIPATVGAAGDTGGMTYKGGGAVTLSAAPAYSGKTTVELGTTLVVPSAIAGANLKVTIPGGLASGLYKVVAVSGGGAFASDVLSSAMLPSGVNARFFLDNGDTEIWCAYSSNASDHIWIGGSTGSLNEGANWLSGSVPASGTAIIGSTAAASLTNPDGSGFAATTIIVPKDSADVTISGAAFSNISKIENYSTSQIEFLNAVTFAANVNVIQSPGIVKFTGGATGVQLGARTDIHGTYNFTKTGDLVEIADTVVKSDGVYKLLDGTFYKHNGDFSVEAGGKVEVGAAKINSKKRTDGSNVLLLNALDGEFKVNGTFLVTGGEGNIVTHYLAQSGGVDGVFIANKIQVNQATCIVPKRKTVMGPGGILRGNGYVRVGNSGSHTFGAYADWTMYHDNLGNTTTASPVFCKHGNSTANTTLTFDTTDYCDNSIGRTITCEAPISGEDAASAEKFLVTVKGIGKFVFANTSDGTIFSGGLTVQDSATVEVVPNSWPGKGAVTLNDNATLKVAKSGTVTLGGDLTLADGTTLAFHFTEDNVAPKLATVDNKNMTAYGPIKVMLSAADGVRPPYTSGNKGKYELTSGGAFTNENNNISFVSDVPIWVNGVSIEDGEIVLSVKPKGTTVFLR